MSFLIHQPWRDAVRWHEKDLWKDSTYAEFLGTAMLNHPDTVAIVDGPLRITWRELRNSSGRFANRLIQIGVSRGDVVIIQVADSAAFVAITMAVQSVNAVASPVSHNAGPSEVTAIADRTMARFYVGTSELPFQGVTQTLLVDLHGPSFWIGPEAPLPPTGYLNDPDAMSELMFTSGTTGRPKGAINSANTKLAGLRGFLSAFDFSSDDVWGLVAPLSHNAGWLYSMLPALATGARSVVVRRGSPTEMLDAFVDHGVTATFLVPTHLNDLLETYRTAPQRWPHKLRYVITGAAAASDSSIKAVFDEWSAIPISMYGMTECQGVLFTRASDSIDVISHSVGRPCPGTDVALLSQTDGTLLSGEGYVGEIVTRGPTNFLGYFDDQISTSIAFTSDGWFRTGDLATIENDNFRVVGRIKDVIQRGGATIIPDDVEIALAGLSGVGEIAVIGLPDARLGERVCLCVIGEAPALELVTNYLKSSGFGRQLYPDNIISVSSFPRTDLGKVQRARLRLELIAQRDASSPSKPDTN